MSSGLTILLLYAIGCGCGAILANNVMITYKLNLVNHEERSYKGKEKKFLKVYSMLSTICIMMILQSIH